MWLRRRNALQIAFSTLLAGGFFPARGQELKQRWQPGAEPPEVEGIRLGDTREHVQEVLGEPEPWFGENDDVTGMKYLRYRHGALMVTVDASGKVVQILLRRSEGGALAGIRVGDRLARC